MKKLAFVSENRRIIEQITAVVNASSDMYFRLLSTSRFTEALSDIRAFKAELVIIDGVREGVSERVIDMRKKLQTIDSVSKYILLTDKDTLQSLNESAETLFDEYVIYDDQLDHLFNKLMEYRVV